MADSELRIVLSLVDQASQRLKEELSAIEKESDKVKKTGKEAGNSFIKPFQDAAKAIRGFKSALLPISIIIGAATVATAEYAKRNRETAQSVNEFGLAIKNSLANLGKFISPVTNALGQLTAKFNDTFGDSAANNLDRSKFAIAEHGKAMQELSVKFQGGAISATEFYNAVITGQNTTIERNKIVEQSLTELATLQSLLGNQELLEARVRTDEQISLLNFQKETFEKAHAGMASFTVAVGKSIQTNLSSAITSVVTGALTAKEAFKQLGMAMIETIVNFIAQKLVAAALEKTLLAGTVAASTVAAGTIAASWAPAAFLATVATLGGAAANAPAALAASGAAATATLIGISAGIKAGLGGANQALNVSPQADGGDYLVSKPTLFLAGEAGPERATFQPIGKESVGGGSAFGDINIFIQGGINPAGSSVDQMAEQLGFAFEKELRSAKAF